MLTDMILAKRGLMLVVGATGSGKSTTLAALLEHRNEHQRAHPHHRRPGGVPVPQQEEHRQPARGGHRHRVAASGPEKRPAPGARRDPDRRNPRPRNHVGAIAYAQSGHLVLATMHANNSYQALNRILNFYPVEVRPSMLNDLASALKAIVSQRLLRTVDGGRVPAVEVMVNSRLMSELIEKGDFFGVREALEKSMAEGSQTFEPTLPA
jgi:twitching motility protein PilU